MLVEDAIGDPMEEAYSSVCYADDITVWASGSKIPLCCVGVFGMFAVM